MPTDIHHTICAAPIDDQINDILLWIENQSEEIKELMCVGKSTHNFFQFVTMLPDGSSDGREASNAVDKARDDFIALLNRIGCEWVETVFGDVDEYKITRRD